MSAWSNWVGKFCFITALAVPILSGASLPVSAQDQQDQQQPQQQPLTQQELAQLVAPIALYPDALLAQVLTASTYPLEVVMAARWSEKNPDLKGAALEDAMQKEPWDPSVKGLTSVPQVLAMMSDKLDWTQQLGEAFLAQPDDIQNAIQALRARADEAGNLKSSKEQKVRRVAAPPSTGYVGPPEYIVIEPVEPDYVYVPVYDPVVVYGADYWPPAYAPFFWYPRMVDCRPRNRVRRGSLCRACVVVPLQLGKQRLRRGPDQHCPLQQVQPSQRHRWRAIPELEVRRGASRQCAVQEHKSAAAVRQCRRHKRRPGRPDRPRTD